MRPAGMAATRDQSNVYRYGERGQDAGEDDERGTPTDMFQQNTGEREEDTGREAGHDGDRQQGPVALGGRRRHDDDWERGLVQAGGCGQSDEDKDGVELPQVLDLGPGQD